MLALLGDGRDQALTNGAGEGFVFLFGLVEFLLS